MKAPKYVTTNILSVTLNQPAKPVRVVIGVSPDGSKILVRAPEGLKWYAMDRVTVLNQR